MHKIRIIGKGLPKAQTAGSADALIYNSQPTAYGPSSSTQLNKTTKGSPDAFNAFINPWMNSTDNPATALASIFDPTGISNWPYVNKAYEDFKSNPGILTGLSLAFEGLGTLPLFGEATGPEKPIVRAAMKDLTAPQKVARVIKTPVRGVVKVIDKANKVISAPAKLVNKGYEAVGISTPMLRNIFNTFNRGARAWELTPAGDLINNAVGFGANLISNMTAEDQEDYQKFREEYLRRKALQEGLDKKAYGGPHSEIPSLFNQPVDRLYKAQTGGTPPNCASGYMVDPNDPTKCIEDPTQVRFTPSGNINDELPPQEVINERAQDQARLQAPSNYDPFKDLNAPSQEDLQYQNDPSYQVNLDTSLYNYHNNNPKDKNSKKYKDWYNKKYGIKKQGFGEKLFNANTNFKMATNFLSGAQKMYQNIGRRRDADVATRMENIRRMTTPSDVPGSKGFYHINTGDFMEPGYDTHNFGEYGGTMLNDSDMNTIKIKILGKDTDAVKMAYGGQSGYGFDLGQRNTYAAMPEGKIQTVSNTIKEVPRDEANIEAEKGETVYGDIDGDGVSEHMNIGGERHVNGGTPLNVPEGSFIFSDTKKMRIKDENVLSRFGLTPRKEGWTPAEIAKRYDINKYKAIIEDPNSDPIMKNTAQIMVKNFQKKLAELALVQEQIKGFPQGIPEMCYGVIPDEILAQIQQQIDEQNGGQNPQQKKPTAQTNGVESHPYEEEEPMEGMPEEQMAPDEEQEPSEEMGMMYGGNYMHGGYYKDGGSYDDDYIPMYQNGGDKWKNKIEKIKKISRKNIAWSDRYKKGDTDIPDTQGAQSSTGPTVYGDITDADIEEFKKRHAWYFAIDPGWDPTNPDDVRRFQKAYNARAKQKGMDFDFFDATSGYKGKDALDGLFGEYTYNAPDISDEPATTDTSVFGYKCTGRTNGKPNVQKNTYKDEAARNADGAVASETEAYNQCPYEGTTKTIPPNQTPPTKVPFKAMTPDKWNMMATGALNRGLYLNTVPDADYESGNYVPKEWRAEASQLQGLTKSIADQIGQSKAGNVSAADLSNLYGTQADKLIGVVSGTDTENVRGWNAFSPQEQARRDKFKLLNIANKTERSKNLNDELKELDAFNNKKMMAFKDAATQMWNNRMQLGLVNATNKFYYTDPTTGRTVFKRGYGPDDLGKTGTAAGPTQDEWQKFQNAFPGQNPTVKDFIDWQKLQRGRFGGSLRPNKPSLNDLANLLSNGYGFPF